MQRRQLLRGGAVAVGLLSGVVGIGAAGDADPRPTTGGAGELPNEDVPYTATGALGEAPFDERAEIPVGDYILHDNGITGEDLAALKRLANQTTSVYTIDGEQFVLETLDDWDLFTTPDGGGRIEFAYFTPPKPKGTQYEVTWEIEASRELFDEFPFLGAFPFSNDVRVVASE